MIDEQLLTTLMIFLIKQMRAAAILLAIGCVFKGLSEVFEQVEERWRESVVGDPVEYFDIETGEFMFSDLDCRVVEEHFYDVRVPAFAEWIKPQFFVSAFLLKASIFPWI